MARGICYHISDNTDDVADDGFNKEWLYDQIGELRLDYVADLDEDKQKEEVETLLENLKQYGFDIGTEKTDDGEYPFFSFTKEMRERYFRPKFEAARKLMGQITLEEFAEKDPYELRSLLQDDDGDCVYAEYIKSFDEFLRDSVPGTKYYIGNAVLMH